MRNNIVAGNWKMNNDSSETEVLLTQLKSFKKPEGVRIMVAPAFTQLAQSTALLKDDAVAVVAQNMNAATSGAYTGEVSASMLKGVGVHNVILGHSERRSLFHETDAGLASKVKSALDEGMEVIFCFGEELKERKSNTHFDVVAQQIRVALFDLPVSAWKQIILAYEPVWAIGTGETASPAQAQEMHAYIRSLIASNYDQATADSVSILYGGSVKPNNAQEIFAGEDVDGGLIGGASLKAEDFMAIVNAF